jgi:uncharacterized integral membrane protein
MHKYSGTGFYSGLFALVLVGAGLIVLAAQNSDSVTVSLMGLKVSAPLFAVLLTTLLLGVLVDEVVGWIWRHRRRRIMADREELGIRRKMQAPEEAVEQEDIET